MVRPNGGQARRADNVPLFEAARFQNKFTPHLVSPVDSQHIKV